MRIPLALLLFPWLAAAADSPPPLAGTKPYLPDGDRSVQMVQGIERWLVRETAQAVDARTRRWEVAAGSDWPAFTSSQRGDLKRIIGAEDPRLPTSLEEFLPAGALPPAAEANAPYSIHHVRWPVFSGVNGEGVLFRPSSAARGAILLVPDADEVPELSILARSLASEGFLVLVPVLVDRRDTWSGSEIVGRFTNQPHREWIHRQAFLFGRTMIGYEVQKILAGADALLTPASKLDLGKAPLVIWGSGEGGLLALQSAALDERFRVTLISGYFGPHTDLYAEPIYRNLFGYLRQFDCAELAALIAPRALIVEPSHVAQVGGPPDPHDKRSGAAPGAIVTPEFARVREEVQRASRLISKQKLAAPVVLISQEAAQQGQKAALEALLAALKLPSIAERKTLPTPMVQLSPGAVVERQHRTVRELESYTQNLLQPSERLRTESMLSKAKPGAEWEAVQRRVRTRLWEEVIGKLRTERVAPAPRTRLIRETESWRGYEVRLEVAPDLFAWGWLLLPRDLKPGERRPVVVCQHGLEGLPEDVVTTDPQEPGFKFYQGFAAHLAEQGYIVYAPHNPYRGHDQFRVLQRRANPLGLSLFSFILAQHEVSTDWLASLPYVDPERIGFYGLSYGGKSAMRIPALLERYALSICSGDFNEWIFKNVSTNSSFSYMFSGEYEMPEWNLARVANYAEMAMCIAPRPFMVERGRNDGCGTDEWIGYEYAKVARGYAKLGLPERTAIEWFEGPHMIHGVGTYEFLRKHLGPGRP